MLTHRGRKCTFVKEFSLQGQVYIVAQVDKNFYLVYPKEEFKEEK